MWTAENGLLDFETIESAHISQDIHTIQVFKDRKEAGGTGKIDCLRQSKKKKEQEES